VRNRAGGWGSVGVSASVRRGRIADEVKRPRFIPSSSDRMPRHPALYLVVRFSLDTRKLPSLPSAIVATRLNPQPFPAAASPLPYLSRAVKSSAANTGAEQA
jgi:hypothetical protein